MSTLTYVPYFLIALLAYLTFSYYYRNRGLPPGPRRLPFIGNIHQLPTQDPWRTYQAWSRQYGPVFSLRVGLDTIVMLNTHATADALLNKRSAIYSSRPRLVMGGECVSKGLRILLMPYGEQWRQWTRLLSAVLNINASKKYEVLQDVESKQVLFELLDSDDFTASFHRYSSSLVYALAYGKRLEKPYLQEDEEIEQIMEGFLYAARVGTWIVDALPALNALPNWLAPWKRHADKLHDFEAAVYTRNLEKGKQAEGWNWTKQILGMKESQGIQPLELAYGVGIVYEAASDTTTMSLEVFILAALTHPEFLKKAQAELDEVVGDKRLPDFDDKLRLPYVQAVVNEVLRWRPVSAGGIPHAVIQDDEFLGYRIPKGATVIGNHWAIHHDEQIYENPGVFNPDRWIKHPDLPLDPWGFGRRICGGQHIAKNSMFINIVRLLWGFDIGHAYVDSLRQEVDPLAMTQGFNSRPLPFKATFKVRSPQRRRLIEREWNMAEKDVSTILGKMGK